MQKEKPMHVNLAHARTEEQMAVMEQIVHDGVCPFCQEHFLKYHPKPILKKGAHWLVTENAFPYNGARVHLLFVYLQHIVLPPAESDHLSELFELITWARKEYGIRGGTLLLLFGETRYNGASVDHLHAHLVVGDADKPDHKGVRVKVG